MSCSISMLYVLLCTIWPVMFYHSSKILDLEKTVRMGFFKYSEPFTTEERTIMSKTNDFVIKSTRISIVAYFCAGFGTFFKEMSPSSIRQYRPPYPGWFPWTINSNFRLGQIPYGLEMPPGTVDQNLKKAKCGCATKKAYENCVTMRHKSEIQQPYKSCKITARTRTLVAGQLLPASFLGCGRSVRNL